MLAPVKAGKKTLRYWAPIQVHRLLNSELPSLCFDFQLKFKFKFIYSHLLNYNTTIREKKGRSKKQSWLYIELNIKKEECVAAKGAKLSSWLLPQSSYKWVEVIRY